MKDFISNNAKFVLDYGQPIIALIILLCLFIIYRIGRKNKYFLPKSIFGWLGTVLLLFVIAILSLAFIGLGSEKKTTGKVLDQFEMMVDKEAPDLSFKMVSNDRLMRLDDFKGDVVLFNIWATWCAPCLKELPDLDRLHQDYRDKGVSVITLSDESRDKLLKFQERNSFDFISGYNQNVEWLEGNIGTARPVTFIIDRKGIIKSYFTGARNYEFFESRIDEIL